MHNKSTIAKLPQNKSKNRFENILPYDHTRVKLRKADRVTSDGRDFINASYFSSMRRQRNYIITQNPMESTIFDFWCMVWENSSLTIVMLSYQEEVSLIFSLYDVSAPGGPWFAFMGGLWIETNFMKTSILSLLILCFKIKQNNSNKLRF